MTINYSTLLGLAEPVTGTESGTWGDDVNLGLTSYLDISIAGTQAVTADSDVTLSTTNGSSSGSNISSTTAQYAILTCTGSRTANRNINVPNSSKTYIVNNSTTGGYSITVRGVTGPTTGVTISNGEQALIAWSTSASDFVKISSLSSGVLSTSHGGTGLTSFTANEIFYASSTSAFAQSTNLQFNGTTLTLANDASIHGLTVGLGAGSVSTNTVVGNGAINNSTGNSNTTAIGYQAIYTGGGGGETALGTQALYSATSSSGSNTAIGGKSLYTNSSGQNNTAVGYQAGYSNTTGGSNAVLGYQALYTNTNGQLNVAIGSQALYSQNADAYNTAVGANSMQSTTSGSSNAALGRLSLNANTTGSYNVALGYSALQSNTTASNNTAVGYQAGYTLSSSYGNNTFIGYQAGYTSSPNSNNGNTCVGHEAGYSLTTGGGNTFIGPANGVTSSPAGYNVTSGNYNTIIGGYTGYEGGLDIRTSSNYIVLSDGAGNPRQIIDNNGNVGIGVTPSYKLDILGSGNPTINLAGSGSYTSIFNMNASGGTNKIIGNGAALQLISAGAYPLIFQTNSTEAARIDTSGNLLVGTTSANGYKLNITAGSSYAALLNCSSSNVPLVCQIASGSGAQTYTYFYNGASQTGSITTTGSNCLFNNLSDERLKENIVDSGSGLDKLANIKIRSFDWIKDKTKVDFGVVAQELNTVAPECVSIGEDNQDGTIKTPWQVDSSVLVPAMIKAIQELSAQVTALQAQVTALTPKGA